MHGKGAESAGRGAGRTANKEQMRMAMLTQDAGDEDRFRVQKLIKKIIESTGCSYSTAELALHDTNLDVELAANYILENPNIDTWTHCTKKGSKGKEEREEPQKKGGNRPARRGNQRDFQQKAGRTENGNEGRENRQPRNKEDGEFRGGRKQQDRPRREPNTKREGKKSNAEHKEEEDDHWKNGPLVFNRRENTEEKDSHAIEPATIKPVSQPTAAGPLSFADVVRKNAQKPQPAAVAESSFKLQVNDTKQAPQSPHNLGDGFKADENAGFLPEASKSPRQPSHQLDTVEPSAPLLHEDTSAAFQPTSQKLQQSLTAQLKNDLGLGGTNAFGTSPPKKYHEPLHQSKASTVKAGVVEFLSSDAPAASSGDWQFGFEAAPAPQSSVADEHQFRREPPSKVNEPIRNEIGLGSSNLNESNAPRSNTSTVFQSYNIQNQSSQPSYTHQPFNRNRNGANNLPFSNNNYSDNFNQPDLRPNYGAPSSPPKTQQPVQPLGSQPIQSHQSHHQQQQHIFPPTQLPYPNYPYLSMYSPVAGLRDEFTPMLPFQNSMYQLSMDALTMLPQLNATSAGPIPTNHQGQHHQNSHPQQSSVQQHNQSSHSQNQQSQRNEHYNENLFLNKQLNIQPGSQQNNGASNHQQNSNLGNQQRQTLVDNNSQGAVAPPPGFGGLATAGPFLSQHRNMFPSSFQAVPFTQFPYVLPKSK